VILPPPPTTPYLLSDWASPPSALIFIHLNLSHMATTTPAANAAKKFTVSVKGFTYIKEFAFLTVVIDGNTERVILGAKSDFPMSDLFQMKQADSVDLSQRDDKEINGVTYKQFRLESINF